MLTERIPVPAAAKHAAITTLFNNRAKNYLPHMVGEETEAPEVKQPAEGHSHWLQGQDANPRRGSETTKVKPEVTLAPLHASPQQMQ